jgi:hypothetical protein
MKVFFRILFSIFQIFLVLLLPFFVLVRGSVWLYRSYELHTWLAFLGGVGMTFLVLLIYLTVFYTLLFGVKKLNKRSLKLKAWIVVLLLATYSTFTLVNFDEKNAKSNEVRKEFRSLHPILRLGMGTVMVFDRGAIVTDLSRTHGDYARMGLHSKKNSLHYKQSSGYVHAIDLRTQGRSGIRNQLAEWSYQLMGFETLRHVGTADHLHISLPPPDKPNLR